MTRRMVGTTVEIRQRLLERYGSPQEAERALREAHESGVLTQAEVDLLLMAMHSTS
jgi:hypothetical protein